MRVLANPVQSSSLETIFKETPPNKRLPVAAAYLGCTVQDIFRASDTPVYKCYVNRFERMKGKPNVYKHISSICEVLGISIFSLFDEEALENINAVVSCQKRKDSRRLKLKVRNDNPDISIRRRRASA